MTEAKETKTLIFQDLTTFNDDDVVLFSENSITRFLNIKEACNHGLKVGFLKDIKTHLEAFKVKIDPDNLLTCGMECQLLDMGAKNWVKGRIKIKITLEFIADVPEIKEPESPLDDIRREIYKDY